MSLIRIRAMEMLKERIECSVPKLKDRVCAGYDTHPKVIDFPHLSIQSTRARYFPDQASEYRSPSPSVGVWNIGRMEAVVQLKIGCSNPDERYNLEDAVLSNVFLADLDRPGVYRFSIPDCEGALAAWELEEDTWQDEFGLDNGWYSTITTTLQIPVLVRKVGVYSINEIRLQFTTDLETPSITLDPNVIEETIIVEE